MEDDMLSLDFWQDTVTYEGHTAPARHDWLRYPEHPGEDVAKLVKRMHYVSFVEMFRSDLFKGLCVGHAPKKCRICGKWFLTTNARHTKYCGGFAPGDKLHAPVGRWAI